MGGQYGREGEEAEGELRAALKGENEQRASSHPCSDHVNHKDVCMYGRDTQRVRKRTGA